MTELSSPFRSKGSLFNKVRDLVRVCRWFSLKVRLRARFSTGSDFSIGKGADIRPEKFFRVGDRVGIGKNLTVECNVDVGNDVLISSNVSLVGNDHKFDDPQSTVYKQGRYPCPTVRLGGDNLIGYGVTIIGPSTLARGVIVAAGAVVKGDFPPDVVIGGVPARVIRRRYQS